MFLNYITSKALLFSSSTIDTELSYSSYGAGHYQLNWLVRPHGIGKKSVLDLLKLVLGDHLFTELEEAVPREIMGAVGSFYISNQGINLGLGSVAFNAIAIVLSREATGDLGLKVTFQTDTGEENILLDVSYGIEEVT